MLFNRQSQRKLDSYGKLFNHAVSVKAKQKLILMLDKIFDKLNRNSIQLLMGNTKRLLALNWKMILMPFVLVLVIFVEIFSQRHSLSFSPDKLTRDPLAIAKLPFFYGIFSNVGIMLWISAATVNFLGAMILRDDYTKFNFMTISGILIVWLGLDDLLMFHEVVFPEYFHVPETVIYLAYLLVMVAYLFFFIHEIYSFTNYTLLVAALLAFGSSILIDVFWGFAFAEDGAKFLGIVFWFAYYFSTVKKFITDRMLVERA